jgi:hypothetical protein
VSGDSDRNTVRIDLTQFARESMRELDVKSADTRPIVPLLLVPWVRTSFEELRQHPLDPRAAFVVSLIDGQCTVAMLLDMAGMAEADTLTILGELLRLGVIELRDPK